MEQLLLECSLLGVCTRVLTLSPTIVTVNCPIIIGSRSYLSSTSGPFSEASQRFHRTIQYTKKKSSPILGKLHQPLPPPYGFHGPIYLEWSRVRVWYCPPLMIAATSPIILSALLCHAPCYNDQQVGAELYLPTAPHRVDSLE